MKKERDVLKDEMCSIDEHFARAKREATALARENNNLDIIVL